MVYILPHKLIIAPVGIYQHYKEQGKIELQIKEEGVPVSRPAYCYHARTGVLVDSKWSDDGGFVSFENLIKGVKYFVVSTDRHTDGKQYNLVGQDLLEAQ